MQGELRVDIGNLIGHTGLVGWWFDVGDRWGCGD